MRAFSLIEVMVVVVIIGVLAAVGVPSISSMVARADGERVLRENATGFAAARDNARGRGVCLDYILRPDSVPLSPTFPAPAVPGPGPYDVDIWAVPCPGQAGPAAYIMTRDVPPGLTQMRIRPIVGGVPEGPGIDRVHFHRDGSLYGPVAPVLVEGTTNGVVRRFRVFPAAGTIEIEESPGILEPTS